ncbi:SUMO-conjugating enzyme UBC9-like protein [Mycena sp. CBHHK59/15]|nr:SUMO-conjugating enzyme UBC9-like protein [Mycena sp. CBHHK59/15]
MPVVDLRQWEAHIPGTTGTPWEGGVYTLSITFGPDFTKYVPKLRFVRPLFHPNAYPTGTWGYTTEDHKIVTKDMPALWKQTDQQDPLRLATLLRSVMTSLHNPDITDPSQSDAYTMLKNDPKAYAAKIMAQALVS